MHYCRQKELNEQIVALQKQLDDSKAEVEQIHKDHEEQFKKYANYKL